MNDRDKIRAAALGLGYNIEPTEEWDVTDDEDGSLVAKIKIADGEMSWHGKLCDEDEK